MIGVTGGGYVGSIIIEKLLMDGYKVRCIDNFHKGNCDHLFTFMKNYPKNFSFYKGDINHKYDCEKFSDGLTSIFNTAAIVGMPQCKRYQVLAKHTHTNGIRNLLDSKDDKCTFIQFSTDSIYGMNEEFCDETTKPNPQSLYGETKLQAEKITLEYENILILRFSTGMGISHVMRNNLLVNDFVNCALRNKKLEIFEPDVSRSFINCNDMASGAIYFNNLLLSSLNKYLIYNIGCDSLNYTKRELGDLVSKLTNCDVSYIQGKDPDCRNYKISHKRQYEAGFFPKIKMEDTIKSLINSNSLIEEERKYQ